MKNLIHEALFALCALAVTACTEASSPEPIGPELSVIARPTIVTDLGTLGGTYSQAWDINDAGVIVGSSETATGSPYPDVHAFRWTKATGMVDLGTLGGTMSAAVAINKKGFIAGVSTDVNELNHLVLWTPTGQVRDLGGATDGFIGAGDINDQNDIVGGADSPNAPSQAFRWTKSSGIIFLNLPAGEIYPSATNNNRDIAGSFCCGNAQYYGWFFSSGGSGWIDIGGITNGNAVANDMNNNRIIVGWDQPNDTLPWQYELAPVRWGSRRGYQLLGSFGGTYGYANGINALGEIVGGSSLVPWECCDVNAFYWSQSRGMVNLGPGVANAINTKEQVVGFALGGHALLWDGVGGVPLAPIQREGHQFVEGSPESCAVDRTIAPSKAARLRCMVLRHRARNMSRH